MPQRGEIYSFGAFQLDAAEKVLLRGGRPVNLPPKALDTLLVLVRNAGHIVEKRELMATIWPDVFVEEGNLTQYVSLLRKALGNGPNGEPHIETVPRRGYRFVAAVSRDVGRRASAGTGFAERLRWQWAAGATLALVAVVGLGWNAWRTPRSQPRSSEWVRLTEFPDSVTSPALSPDGQRLAFLRGPGTFTTAGQLWVRRLPDGDAVQLTDDAHVKMGPVFSPDGFRIAYTVPWDTWEVPVSGGLPRPWLSNASGLTWVDAERILFSEIQTGLHMAVVSAPAHRTGSRDVYVPDHETMMAHRSYASPDGRWALIVEMETAPLSWLPCRLVAIDGRAPDRQVGPPRARCTAAAWAPDGQSMYFTADDGTGFHIWRQRFPDGDAEQLTFGPTEQEGLAVTPDGRSVISAVGVSQSTVWIRDAGGERRMSLEGNAARPRFSPDGGTLYYLERRQGTVAGAGSDQAGELWRADVETGRLERALPGVAMELYELSNDGRRVVFTTRDGRTTTIWMAPLDRAEAPRALASSESFGRGGARLVGPYLFFVVDDGPGLVSIHRMNITDGQREEVVAHVNGALGLSPDGQWVVAGVPAQQPEQSVVSVAHPVGGGRPVPICDALCSVRWDAAGTYVYVSFLSPGEADIDRTLVTRLTAGQMLPALPPDGLQASDQVDHLPGWFTVEPGGIVPGPTPEIYAFTRRVVHRNLYRIPIS